MRTSIWVLVICAAFLACVNAECKATVVGTARVEGGSFEINGVPHQIYDISVTNTGTQTITKLFAFFGFPASSSVYQSWNYDPSSGEISEFGDNISPSTISFDCDQGFNGAGFILAGGDTPTVAFITPTCEGDDEDSSSAPTDTPTDTPTEAPTSTPTSTPTDTPTVAPSPCNIGASLRLGSSWTTDGQDYASYHLFLKNNGECPMTDYVTSFGLNGGEIISTWNLEGSRGGYAVKGFGELLHAGGEYGGAGFNVKLGGEISITPYGSNCQC